MAKQVRMKGVDRISNLPDAILSHMLSFLPTKEAVRVSILSTRWRYLFASVSNLDFELDDKLLLRRNKRKSSTIKSFVNFVNRVLIFHNTSIEKFSLNCGEAVDSSHVYCWISAALWRGVQHLDLCVNIDRLSPLPGLLFTCRTLVTLKLDIKLVFNAPTDLCFPKLKTLCLRSIEFLDDDSVKRLLSSCISLEDILIQGCDLNNLSEFNISHPLIKRLTILGPMLSRSNYSYRIVMDAPNLVYFQYSDYIAAGYSLVNLQSLDSANIGLLQGTDPHPDYITFFRGIHDARSLKLSTTSLKHLLSCVPVPAFRSMVQLEIYRDCSWSSLNYNSWEKGVETLLRSSYELRKLIFHQGLFRTLPKDVPYCIIYKLKEIEISGFTAEKDCIEKAKYFLKNARVLEKLTVSIFSQPYRGEKDKLKIRDEFFATPKKSKQCCILIL